MFGVCGAEGGWGGKRGIEDREVYDIDKVKKVSGLKGGGAPMWQTMLPVSKGGSPWESEVDWDWVACLS